MSTYDLEQQLCVLGSTNIKLVSKHIQAYYSLVISLANNNYKESLANDTEIEIELFIKSFKILTTENSSKFTTSKEFYLKVNNNDKDENQRQYVDCDLALPEFNQWILYQMGSEALKSDVSILFTYANIYAKNVDILGLSVIGGACNLGINGIVIEDDGSFSSSKTLAHELAHTFGINIFILSPDLNDFYFKGVPHDIEQGDKSCSDDDNYIMATSSKNENILNSFFFSKCSIKTLKENILDKHQYDCIFNIATHDDDYNKLSSFIPGQLYNADEQCKLICNNTTRTL